MGLRVHTPPLASSATIQLSPRTIGPGSQYMLRGPRLSIPGHDVFISRHIMNIILFSWSRDHGSAKNSCVQSSLTKHLARLLRSVDVSQSYQKVKSCRGVCGRYICIRSCVVCLGSSLTQPAWFFIKGVQVQSWFGLQAPEPDLLLDSFVLFMNHPPQVSSGWDISSRVSWF